MNPSRQPMPMASLSTFGPCQRIPTGQCILNGYQFNGFGPDIGLGSVGQDSIV